MIRIERRLVTGQKVTPLKELGVSPFGALQLLAGVELPCGAEIAPRDDNHHHNKMKVMTRHARGVEESVYRGSKENMKLLHDFHFFVQFSDFSTVKNEQGEDVYTDERMNSINPEIVHLLQEDSPHRTTVATLLASGITCPKEIMSHHTRSVDDIIGAVELMREGHISSLHEVLVS